jgi:hypothetical protein
VAFDVPTFFDGVVTGVGNASLDALRDRILTFTEISGLVGKGRLAEGERLIKSYKDLKTSWEALTLAFSQESLQQVPSNLLELFADGIELTSCTDEQTCGVATGKLLAHFLN